MWATPWVKISKEGTFIGFLDNMDNKRRRSTSSITDLIWCCAVKRDGSSTVCPCGSGPLVCDKKALDQHLVWISYTLTPKLSNSFQQIIPKINRKLLNTLNSLQQEIAFWHPVHTDTVFLHAFTHMNRSRNSQTTRQKSRLWKLRPMFPILWMLIILGC